MPNKMPNLNCDILFDIARKVIESGDQNVAFQFGVSGREPLQALINAFKSVGIVKLFPTYYTIGWVDNKLCRFDVNDEKTFSKYLFNYIGAKVKDLYLGCQNVPMYSSLVTKLIDAKKLSSFAIDISSDYILASQLLTAFSTSLKVLKIPHNALSETFIQLPSNLEDLTTLDDEMADVMCFNFEKLSLSISSDFWLWKQILIEKFIRANETVSRFTHLTFNSKTNHSVAFPDVNPSFLMRAFPSLEELKFNHKLLYNNRFNSHTFEEFLFKFKNAFENMPDVPSKMVYNVQGAMIPSFWFLDRNFNFNHPFVPFYRRKFLYYQSRATVFEVVVFKQR